VYAEHLSAGRNPGVANASLAGGITMEMTNGRVSGCLRFHRFSVKIDVGIDGSDIDEYRFCERVRGDSKLNAQER